MMRGRPSLDQWDRMVEAVECLPFGRAIDLWFDKKGYRKEWLKAHPEYGDAQRKVNQHAWHRWFIENGYGVPSIGMHYHHRDPESKSFAIALFTCFHAVSRENIQLMEEELKKCIYITSLKHPKIHKALRRWKNYCNERR